VNRLVLGEFLKAWGADIVFASDGEEALSFFEAATFDVLLIDRQMPKLDGEAVVKIIRQRKDERASIPIIAVTADAMESDREKMLSIGVDAFVSKPLKPEVLKRTIADMVRKPASAADVGAG